MGLFDEFRSLRPKGDPKAEAEEAKKREGKCLVLFAHGEGMVLTWMAGSVMEEFVSAMHGAEGGSFDAADLEVPPGAFEEDVDNVAPEGLFIGEFAIIDDGAESWEMPHIRDYVLGMRKLRRATKEEWAAHRRGEWPWEPLEGSRFYDRKEEG